MFLQCGQRRLDLSMPVVMGILNVTPDSFSDGGRYVRAERAVEHALAMIEAGAQLIDVGGESTRPGAEDVTEAEEIERVVPIVRALASSKAIVSLDTSKAVVMRAGIEAGASLINDVRALREEGALDAVASTDVGVCLMHMQGQPRTMQANPTYTDVVVEVREFLAKRIDACVEQGIEPERICIDPGIGFGKRLEHNVQLLAAIPELLTLERPLLIGVSRKSMFASLLGRAVDQRLAGSVAAATAAALAGAHILRVHDVAETVDAMKVVAALKRANYRMQ